MKKLLLAIAAIVISLASLKIFTAPYIWISLCWFLFFLYSSLSSRRSFVKALCFNIGIVILAFGFYEAYLLLNNPAKYRFEYNSTKGQWWSTYHDFLGKIPVKDNIIHAKKYYGNKLIYDVNYTIDPQGLRKSYPDNGGEDIPSILFFGGSYMFGFGLNDTDSMPYQVGKMTNGKYRIYNFGVPNAGPHQMLSALEFGFVSSIITGKPGYAIYEGIFDHVRRAAGLNRTGRHGPKYTLSSNGSVVYQGHFDDFDKEESTSLISRILIKLLQKSLTYQKIIDRRKNVNQNDIDLFVGIIAKSRDLIEKDYPGIKFHVLLWNDDAQPESEMKEIIYKLRGKGISVQLIRDILSVDNDKEWLKYRISDLDGHPNAKANQKMAEFLIKEIFIN